MLVKMETQAAGGGSESVCGTVDIPVNSSVEIDTGLSEIHQFVLFGYRNTSLTDATLVCIVIYNKDASTTQAISAYSGTTVAYRNIDPSAYVTNGNIISAVNGGKVTIEGIRQSSASPNNYHWFAR